MIGEMVSHYRVLDRIGQGGMGIVYKAEDTRLGRFVALKFLQPPGTQRDSTSPPPPDASALERFRREARAMSSLNHPSICAVYDVGEYRGQPFIAMEYLEGETLRARLDGSLGFAPFRADEVLEFAIQIAAGLEVAHEHGIIHRDIKPTNIFITTLEQAKILDFGLARLTRKTPAPASAAAAAITRAATDKEARPSSWSGGPLGDSTVVGTALGTLFYMSPEQGRGEELDARTDLYSFGLVLNEMTAAWQSFQGKARDGVRPRSDGSDAELLSALETIIATALKEDRNERYQTAGEMKLCLTRLKTSIDARRVSGHAPQASTSSARFRLKYRVAGLLALAVVGAGLFCYYRYYAYFGGRSHPLASQGSIVLADFVNSTGDPVFTDTLRQALGVALSQSPLLNVLSESNVETTLRLMERPPSTPLNAPVAREVCQRNGSAAYVIGSIASLGRQYVVELKAVGCRRGDTLAVGQAMAGSKEQVLDALGRAASGLRRKLGESLGSVEKFDVPLRQATTSSFEALEDYCLGLRAYSQKGLAAALPLFHRATELDPNFALVYEGLGLAYANAGESALASENLRKGYSLRARVSERERFYIEAHYERAVTGDLDKARQIYEVWTATYPRDPIAHGDMAVALSMLGQYDRALEENGQARSLDPLNKTWAANAVNYEMTLDRLKEARAAYDEAFRQKLDSDYLHTLGYDLAFLVHDVPGMAEQVVWAKARSGTADVLLAAQADTEAYAGHLGRARDLSRQAAEFAEEAGEQETAAGWQAQAALREALFGEAAEARSECAAALARSRGRDVSAAVGLALALSGDRSGADRVANDLAHRFPQDTVVNLNYLPAIRAATTISRPARRLAGAGAAPTAKTPAETSTAAPVEALTKALDELHPVIPHEFGIATISSMSLNLYPVYVRGLAYLALGQGPEAAVEFQKIIDHAGIVVNEPIGALARLNLARAYALEAGASPDAVTKARTAYQDFLALWKNADPGIPVFEEARTEVGKL
jgi:serine/threonine protein kinase/Flp pilus assembly protein TadD